MIKNTLLIIAVILIIYQGFQNFIDDKKIDKLTIEKSQLSEDLKMKTVIYKDKVIYQVKENEKTKTVVKYLPPESSATITTDIDGQSSLSIQNKGFTFEPAASFISTSEFLGGLSCRLLFWDRYGVGIGLNSKIRPYIYADRRISDFIPFAQNTTIGVCYDGDFGLIISLFF